MDSPSRLFSIMAGRASASKSQARLYDRALAASSGTPILFKAYAKDNRILPIGFDKATAGEAFAVRGTAVEDETFAGGLDRVGYRIDVAGHEGPYTVRAALLYQSVSYRFAQDLCQGETPAIETVCSYLGAADHTPAVVASVERKVR